ncbi:hypothetical protein Tco_1225147 [Tanacetum coccineum]
MRRHCSLSLEETLLLSLPPEETLLLTLPPKETLLFTLPPEETLLLTSCADTDPSSLPLDLRWPSSPQLLQWTVLTWSGFVLGILRVNCDFVAILASTLEVTVSTCPDHIVSAKRLFANARFCELSASIGGPHLGRFLSEWQHKVSIRVVTEGFDLEGFQLAFKGSDQRCEFLIGGVSFGVSRGVSPSEVHEECLYRWFTRSVAIKGSPLEVYSLEGFNRRPLIRELGETRITSTITPVEAPPRRSKGSCEVRMQQPYKLNEDAKPKQGFPYSMG